jgi:SNF2 family DNA or RNA helicase
MKSGWLVPRFNYDERIIALVKTITGRSYDKSTRTWYVPCFHVLEVMEKLGPIGFRFDADVREYRAKLVEHLANVERSRTQATYNGRLTATLLPYQRIGAGFMQVARRALLADQMGLGKTVQTIAACEGTKRVLVLCPASNKYGWRDEIAKFGSNDDTVAVVDGDAHERAEAWRTDARWKIANYELLLRPGDLSEMRRGWDAVICDEATRISNGKAKTTIALKTVPADKKYALTGTPVSNRPSDVWSIVDWLYPGLLGTWGQFLEAYAVFDDWGERGKIVGFKDLQGLSARLAPVMLRRTKPEVLKDLPPKTVQDVVFDLSKEEWKVYDAVKTGIMAGLTSAQFDEDRGSLGEIMVKMLRLKQVTGSTALVGDGSAGSTKLEVLCEKLGDVIAGGEKALVFTQFAEMAKIISRRLTADGVVHRVIMGEVAHEDRQRFVNEFNDDENVPLLNMPGDIPKVMVMTEAGAYGLNLQAASYVINFDLPWSIAKTLQREDRAHRMGQARAVTILNLVARGTIDEYVAKVLKRKNREAVEILKDDVRLEESGLSREDVKEILRI